MSAHASKSEFTQADGSYFEHPCSDEDVHCIKHAAIPSKPCTHKAQECSNFWEGIFEYTLQLWRCWAAPCTFSCIFCIHSLNGMLLVFHTGARVFWYGINILGLLTMRQINQSIWIIYARKIITKLWSGYASRKHRLCWRNQSVCNTKNAMEKKPRRDEDPPGEKFELWSL